MAAEEITQIVCYSLWTGDGSGTYDESAMYDDWTEAAHDIKAALDHGRDVLVQRELMTRAEFERDEELDDAARRRLIGTGAR